MTKPSSSETKPPLKSIQRVGYGIAEIGNTSVEIMLQLYLLKFYISFVGLKSQWAGLALACAVIFDALTDPIMGGITDHTNRKRIFILAGGFSVLLSFPLVFNPPELNSQMACFLFLTGSYILLNISTTIIGVPHAALGAEMTQDPNERNILYGMRLFFGNIGLLLGVLSPSLFLIMTDKSYTNLEQVRELSYIIGFIVFITAALTFWLTRSKNSLQQKIDQNALKKRQNFKIISALRHSFLSVSKNQFFMILLAAFFIATLGRTINASLALYYYENYLNLSSEQTSVIVLGIFIVCISLSIPLWICLAKRFGKKIPAFWGILLLGIMTTVLYPLFQPKSLIGPLFAAVLGGGLVGSILLLESLVADISEKDELSDKHATEGVYFGFWKFSSKVSRALGLALTGFLLNLIGFQEGIIKQSPEVSFKLALLFGPLVGIFFIIGALLLYRLR